MYLIMAEEWWGQRKEPGSTIFTNTKKQLVSFITLLEISEALIILKQYEIYFKKLYTGSSIEYTLLCITKLDIPESKVNLFTDLDSRLIDNHTLDSIKGELLFKRIL
jgi:hypothetical protein